MISFSGGKDSTVTADVVVKALSNPSLVHIFGNTTLEFPSTVEYAERFRKNHPQSIFLFAKNEVQNFMDVCEDIGPPARMMRWCCSMFKTGPITRVINSLYRPFATAWTIAHQAPMSVGFLRQEYRSGLPFPSPEELPNPGIKPASPTLACGFFTTEPRGKPQRTH